MVVAIILTTITVAITTITIGSEKKGTIGLGQRIIIIIIIIIL